VESEVESGTKRGALFRFNFSMSDFSIAQVFAVLRAPKTGLFDRRLQKRKEALFTADNRNIDLRIFCYGLDK
jgi:hypothetical protein